MPEQPRSIGAPLASERSDPTRGGWTPGVWLMRRLSPATRVALILGLSLLPIFSWLSPLAALPHIWLPLLALALYGWVCAALAAPAVASGARSPSEGQSQPLAPPTEGLSTAQAVPPELPPQHGSGDAQTLLADATRVLPEGDPAWSADPDSPEPEPEPAYGAVVAVLPEAADFRVGHAEIRGATDEIARRVVGTSGLLDACSKAAADVLADVDALHDEDRHAHKLLSVLRGRLLQLAQRCHALTVSALQPRQEADGAARLLKQAQALEALVVHIHELAERLGSAERVQGARLDSLRRSAERVDGHAERGLRESQQIMQLTRRVFQTLDAAEQDLRRVEGGSEAAVR